MTLERWWARLLLLLVGTVLVGTGGLVLLAVRALLTHDLVVAVRAEAAAAAPAWVRDGVLPQATPPGIRLVVFAPDGLPVAWTGGVPPAHAPRPGLTVRPRVVWWVRRLPHGAGWLLAAGARQVAVGRPVRRLAEVLVVSTAVALAVTALLARRVARALARPLSALAEAARRVSESADLDARWPPPGPLREVADLVGALTWMLATLREAFAALRAAEQRERALREAALHEVLTPVAALAGLLELVHRGVLPPREAAEALGRARSEVDRLARRVRALLDPEGGEEAELGEVARVAAAGRAARLVGGPGPVRARVPPSEALLVLRILLDNAERHNPPGTPIEIHWEVVGDEAVAVVRDLGIGMDAETARRALERGFRGPTSAVGSGLGLPLARELVTARGGRLALESALGHGTRVEVRWPASTP